VTLYNPFHSEIADGTNATLVRPGNYNAPILDTTDVMFPGVENGLAGYGCVGNGTSNDSAAFAAAATAERVVHVRAGHYLLGNVNFPSGRTFVFHPGVTIHAIDGAYAFAPQGLSNARKSDISFIFMPGSELDGEVTGGGIKPTYVDGLTVEGRGSLNNSICALGIEKCTDVRIGGGLRMDGHQGTYGGALVVQESQHVTIDDVRFHDSMSDFIIVYDPSSPTIGNDDIKVLNCTMTGTFVQTTDYDGAGNGRAAIHCYRCFGSTIVKGNHLSATCLATKDGNGDFLNTHGGALIRFRNSTNFIVSDNQLYNNENGDGISVVLASGSAGDCGGGIIAANQIYDMSAPEACGISVDAEDDYVTNPGANDHVHPHVTRKPMTIVNNRIVRPGAYGIIGGAANSLVQGNTVIAPGSHGIGWSGGNHSQLLGNTIHDLTNSNGILLSSSHGCTVRGTYATAASGQVFPHVVRVYAAAGAPTSAYVSDTAGEGWDSELVEWHDHDCTDLSAKPVLPFASNWTSTSGSVDMSVEWSDSKWYSAKHDATNYLEVELGEGLWTVIANVRVTAPSGVAATFTGRIHATTGTTGYNHIFGSCEKTVAAGESDTLTMIGEAGVLVGPYTYRAEVKSSANGASLPEPPDSDSAASTIRAIRVTDSS
jgi:hypothetical protein